MTEARAEAHRRDRLEPPERSPGQARFIIANRASLGSLAVFVLMMAIFICRQSARLHDLGALQLGADDAAGGDLHDRAAGLRRHRRRDRPVVPGDDGLRRLDVRAGRAGRLRPLPRNRGGDRHRASLLGFLVGSLVVYANLSSLIATLGMNFVLRGLILIFTEGKSIALATLSQTWAFKIFSSSASGASRSRSSGRSPSRSSRPSSTAATGSACRSTSSATTPTAPSRWASTSSACG